MTREQIEKAAQDKAKEFRMSANRVRTDIDVQNIFQLGFMAGAQWRINSVWHDASEIPEKGRSLLEFCRGTRCGEFYEIGGRVSIKDQEWDDFYNFAGIVCWAYIDELIAERKEEAK